jgi:hypothetical protein
VLICGPKESFGLCGKSKISPADTRRFTAEKSPPGFPFANFAKELCAVCVKGMLFIHAKHAKENTTQRTRSSLATDSQNSEFRRPFPFSFRAPKSFAPLGAFVPRGS